jgi:uncharacterized protein (TIGR02996 family)
MTERDWQSLLDREPADATLRLQYSDWLEEQGQMTDAEVQRWLARASKYPNWTGIDWEWWQEGIIDPCLASHRILPRALFLRLSGGRLAYRTYASRNSAEQDLIAAWARYREAGGSLP